MAATRQEVGRNTLGPAFVRVNDTPLHDWFCFDHLEAAAGHHCRDGDSKNVGRKPQHHQIWIPLHPARPSRQSCCSYHQEQRPRYTTRLTLQILREELPVVLSLLYSATVPAPDLGLCSCVCETWIHINDLLSFLAPCPVRVAVVQVCCMGVTVCVCVWMQQSLH